MKVELYAYLDKLPKQKEYYEGTENDCKDWAHFRVQEHLKYFPKVDITQISAKIQNRHPWNFLVYSEDVDNKYLIDVRFEH